MTSLGEDHIRHDTQLLLVFAIPILRQTKAASIPRRRSSAALIPEPNQQSPGDHFQIVRLTLFFKDQS